VHDGGRDQAAAHREHLRSAIPYDGTANMPKVGVLAGDRAICQKLREEWVDISLTKQIAGSLFSAKIIACIQYIRPKTMTF